MKIHLLLLVCFVFFLSGCNSPGTVRKAEGFEAFVNGYIANLRWARYNEALNLHADKAGEIPIVDLDRLKPIRVTGHKVLQKIISPEFDSATVVFTMSYTNDDFGTLKEETVSLQLWYKEESQRWLVESAFPKFK